MALMEKVSSGSGDGKRCVLITGCSAGIGFACAAYLVQQGYTVFAGVRKDADADRLKGLNLHNLIPVCPLDLKMTEQIDAAITFVKEELYKRGISGLYSLVNNAGGGFIAPLEIMDIGKFRAEFETRIMGPLILLQKCLPLIRNASGRILWVVPPAIMPIAFDSPIHVADFAVNGIIRTFRLEFRKTGMKIPIIMIRCGCIKTEASDKAYNDLDKSMSEWPEEKLKLYFGALKETKDKYKSYDNKRTEPVEVAKIVYTALSAEKPRKKYRIGYLSGLSAFLEYLPQNLMDRLINLG